MPIENYNTTRDNNSTIPPGNIRSDSDIDQQKVNSIRQIMADLATWIRGPQFINPIDGVTLNRPWETIYDGAVSFSNSSLLEFQGLGVYDKLRINHHFIPAVANAKVYMRVGNGTTWVSGANTYAGSGIYNTEGSATPAGYLPSGTELTIVDLCWSNPIAVNPFGVSNTIDVIGFNKSVQTKFFLRTSFFNGTSVLQGNLTHRENGASPRDSLQFGGYAVAGGWTGQLLIEGRRG